MKKRSGRHLPAFLRQLPFLLPGLLGTAAFFLAPLGYCLLYSFSRTSGSFTFAGLQGFAGLLRSGAFQRAFANTFLLLFACVGALLLLALALHLLLGSGSGTLAFLALLSAVMFLPPALPVSFVQSFPALWEGLPRTSLLLIFLWKHIGIQTLILKTAAQGMNPAWSEAARIDGAGRLKTFFSVELFYLLPHLKFLFLFDITCFFKLFRESYLLYGLYPPERIYMIQNFFFNNFENANYQRLSSGAAVTVLVLSALNFLVYKAGESREIL